LEVDELPGHLERLYRAAYALCGRREDAEDLIQETYARVLRRPRLLRRDDDPVHLLRVLRKRWIGGRRVDSARGLSGGLGDVEFIADSHGDPGCAALELRAMYAAIQELPEPLKETVVAVDVLGLSYKKAARALSTKEGTIMSRLDCGRGRIASELDAPDSSRLQEPARREATREG
jgi:RNA polymerase sigma-70 factor (ECF subfamily)